MSVQVQHRRDTNANVEANTPAAGELWWDTSKEELGIGNGALAGGIRHQKKNIREILAPAQIVANTNDYNPANQKHAAVLRLTTDASRNLTGMVPTGVVNTNDGRQITLYNAGSFNLVVQDQNAASSAANRFDLGGADITLASKQSVTLRYSTTLTRWEIAGGNYGQAIADSAVTARKLNASAFGAFSNMINGTIVESPRGQRRDLRDQDAGRRRSQRNRSGVFHLPRRHARAWRFCRGHRHRGVVVHAVGGIVDGIYQHRAWQILAGGDRQCMATVLLGAINCLNGPSIFPLAGFASSPRWPKAALAARISYRPCTQARRVTSKPYALLGYASYETGVATVGNWVASPTRLQLYGPGVPLPVHRNSDLRELYRRRATGTTLTPFDDTILRLPRATNS